MTTAPAEGQTVPDRHTVEAALTLASRAPSVHNSQPWRWEWQGGVLHLFSDRTRQLPLADPRGRQMIISCGAMLQHARTAFLTLGWGTEITLLPERDRPDHLAALRFRAGPELPDAVRIRAEAITARYSERRPMRAPREWSEVPDELAHLAVRFEILLDVLDERARTELTKVSGQTAALQRYDMPYQAELRWWAGHSGQSTGIPERALNPHAAAALVPIARDFPQPEGADAPRDRTPDAAALLVLSSPADTPDDWIRTGGALSIVLLECAAAGIATCTLTHITELAQARNLIAGLLPDHTVPQLIIRAGTAPDDGPRTATPRLPVSDFLVVR
ncbi:Acg family FMN-binding oxidoreductase [Nocardia sp. NPDC003693]